MIKEKPDIRKKITSEEKPEKLSKLPESPESYELESYDKKESEKTFSIIVTPEDFMLDNTDSPGGIYGFYEKKFLQDKFMFLYRAAWDLTENKNKSLSFLKDLSEFFHREISSTDDIEMLKEKSLLNPDMERKEEFFGKVPNLPGSYNITDEWIDNMCEKFMSIFRDEISSFDGSVSRYYETRLQDLNIPEKIFFNLVEAKDEEFPFAFMVTYSEENNGVIEHRPLKSAMEKYRDDPKKIVSLIAPIMKIEKESDIIHSLLESGELFYPVGVSEDEAFEFLKSIPLYTSHGIKCRVPNWWKTKSRNFSMTLRFGENKAPLSLDVILSVIPEITMENIKYTPEELKSYLELSEGLHFIKNKWVEINHKKIEELLTRYESAKEGFDGSAGSALEIIRKPEKNGFSSKEQKEFLKAFSDALRNASSREKSPVPQTFKGLLRPYQKEGYHWLKTMNDLKLGVCLADDMGLGKTVQVLAYLEKIRKEGAGRCLLVVPASLIGNWIKEKEKFTPDMPLSLFHGPQKEMGEFLTVTTYGTLRRKSRLNEENWDTIILDEAQTIKNAASAQSKTIHALNGKMKIAMTGTPIENNLGDLYSIMSFIMPGLLGSSTEFKKFVKYMENDEETGYEKLRLMVQPFLMRRLKTDKNIIKDLPEKIETMEYLTVTQKQAVLYRKVTSDLEKKLNEKDGIARKGLVLSTLSSLKQILNHPSQYSGDNAFTPSDSSKFTRLKEIAENIYEKRERLLVFTQYREMCGPIADFLKTIFKSEGLVIHGGVTPAKRTKIVERFSQDDEYVPFMVLSLKAGGVGLNLTSANHVVHFDRWWNPAAENQATDRAFRIGQKKNVQVYKFVTQGTIEEKIDKLISGKTELSESIVTENKAPALTELKDDRLLEIFRLDT